MRIDGDGGDRESRSCNDCTNWGILVVASHMLNTVLEY